MTNLVKNYKNGKVSITQQLVLLLINFYNEKYTNDPGLSWKQVS